MNNNWMELIILERVNKVEQTFELNISSHHTPLKPEIALGEDRFRPFLCANRKKILPSPDLTYCRIAFEPQIFHRARLSIDIVILIQHERTNRNEISEISAIRLLMHILTAIWCRRCIKVQLKCLQVYVRISEKHSAKLKKKNNATDERQTRGWWSNAKKGKLKWQRKYAKRNKEVHCIGKTAVIRAPASKNAKTNENLTKTNGQKKKYTNKNQKQRISRQRRRRRQKCATSHYLTYLLFTT